MNGLFYCAEGYHRYLQDLAEQARKFGCHIHAYCLMTDHGHLLVTPERRDSAGLMMKHLGQRCVQYVIRTYRPSGRLWGGRFKSCLAQSEHDVLACYRCIELNPVRAGMVEHPADYPWSSYRFSGEGMASALLSQHALYRALGQSREESCRRYRALFREHLERELIDKIRQATNGELRTWGCLIQRRD